MSTVQAMPVRELLDRMAPPWNQPKKVNQWERMSGFLRAALADRMDLADPIVVLDERQGVRWFCVAVRSPGRTALLVLSPAPRAAGQSDPLVRAVRLAADQEQAHGTDLLQALLEPAQQEEARLLESAGFTRLAELIYMEAPLPDKEDPATPRRDDATTPGLHEEDRRVVLPSCPRVGLSVAAYSPANHAQFAQVIRASYVNSLDCPGLEGLRRIEDVMAGHRASGIFRPDLWFLFSRDDQPVGVILLNEVAGMDGRSVELIYMGLSGADRGRGFGGRMLDHGMLAARRTGHTGILVAVDANNRPAIRLYRDRGFVETIRRIAYINPRVTSGRAV